MRDFMFYDNESGEEFFVECASLDEAWNILNDDFGDTATIEFVAIYTVAEAEMIGLDTY